MNAANVTGSDTEQMPVPPSRSSRGLVVALVAALVVVGVLTTLLVVRGQAATPKSASEPAPQVAALLEARVAAMNRSDGKAAAALYTEDAVMDELEGVPYAKDGKATYNTVGRAAIQERLQGMLDDGLRLEVIGEPVMYGDLVAEPVRFYQEGGTGYGKGMLVFQITPENLIAHQWMIGWVDG